MRSNKLFRPHFFIIFAKRYNRLNGRKNRIRNNR